MKAIPPTMRNPLLVAALSIALGVSELAAECFEKPRKPVKVAGALCGAVFDTVGERVPDIELSLYDQSNRLVAHVTTDAKAGFTFPVLPKGNYRMQTKGLYIKWGAIEITTSNSLACKKPLTIYAGVSYPDCAWGWISRGWDYRRFPDGPPRN